MDPNIFSLEINEKYTRIADLKLRGNTIELQALGYKETEPNFYSTESDQVIEKQSQNIEELISHLRIRKKTVNVILPDAYTFSQIIEMPQLKEKELLAAIRYQADEFIPMPIDETVLDIEVLSENPKTKKLLLFIVACPKKVIEQIRRTVEKAHLLPGNMENELSAAGRLSNFIFGRNSQKQPGTASILVNFGYKQSSLYLFDHETSLIIQARTFKVGLDLFAKEVKINLNVDDAKALDAVRTLTSGANQGIQAVITPGLNDFSVEVDRFIELATTHHKLNVNSLYIYNFDAHCPILSQTLKSKFALPVESMTLSSSLVKNSIATTFAPYMSSFVSVIGGTLE